MMMRESPNCGVQLSFGIPGLGRRSGSLGCVFDKVASLLSLDLVQSVCRPSCWILCKWVSTCRLGGSSGSEMVDLELPCSDFLSVTPFSCFARCGGRREYLGSAQGTLTGIMISIAVIDASALGPAG